ncbi:MULTISPECIES: TspO/MBR family protein [Rhodopseudomonas]|uniref:TspO/MBR family protein n=1 Tax=Rhodopseudomonas TaxID=1073 RepID=UPI000641B769|nr:TspO/MBR family protein [Rhodopseudomonas palustris]NEW86533.1 tryptophan-rich sensory protein [Rhodopseudomonas sp. WA056]QDL96438.1 tryptophan-rich sensory protein [Rhodopseudomonas palustris]
MNPIFVAAAVALFVGLLGGSLTDTGTWYQSLVKPWWQPPDWAFGPAWTVIFALAAMSAVYAWRGARTRAQRDWVIGLFAANGFFNVLWSMLFFTVRRPDWALLEVPLLWLSVLAGVVVFWRSARTASYYLLPYLVWVTFAAYLNWTVVALNTPF